jgi:CubicO group peptidase (beta-lactamase class C family)
MKSGRLAAAVLFVVSCGHAPLPPPPRAPVPAPHATNVVPAKAPIDPSGLWHVRWDRGFANWSPTIFEGALDLRREGDHWTGSLSFQQSSAKFAFRSLRIDGDRIHAVFAGPVGGEQESELVLQAWLEDGRLIGEVRWSSVPWSPFGGRRFEALVHHEAPQSFPSFDVAKDVDAAKLHDLVIRATSERSSAIVIAKDGKIGLELYRDGYDGSPILAMSVSKSLASLAVGLLIADGKLSLDTTMGSLFPEWKKLGAPKANITVRHLVSHTSGLAPERAKFDSESIRQHTLDAKVVFPPGTRFQYNNAAADFLAVVVAHVAGMPFDTFVEQRIFSKIEVVGATWMKDTEGTPRAAGELVIRPVDLVKIGQLMLDGGKWGDAQIVPKTWVEQSVAAGQSLSEECGLLWWREGTFSRALTEPVLAAWKDAGVDDAALKGARKIVGKTFAGRKQYFAALTEAVGGQPAFSRMQRLIDKGDHVPFWAMRESGAVRGFSARGWLGQLLVVLPKSRVVGLRMRKMERSDEHDGAEADAYADFPEDIARLFGEL